MPFRTDENRTTIHFLTFAEMPSMIYEACKAKDVPSNTRYVQEAICRRLADDMGYDYDVLVDHLPPGRRTVPTFNTQRRIGPANTHEEVI
jgi:hypothetical protein